MIARLRQIRLQPARSVLWLLAALFLGSAALRAASGPGQAALDGLASASLPAAPECGPPPDLAVALDLIARRQAELEDRAAALEERAATLRLAEAEITRNLAALQAAEQQLAALVTVAEDGAESDLARLTSVYETMKPKDAAAVFGAMDPDFAAGFLGRMRPAAAAAVMAGLPPDRAYSISLILAARNAMAPTE